MDIPPRAHPTMEGGRSTTETGNCSLNRGRSLALPPPPCLGWGKEHCQAGLSLNSILWKPGRHHVGSIVVVGWSRGGVRGILRGEAPGSKMRGEVGLSS